jgi:hypothetical protein
MFSPAYIPQCVAFQVMLNVSFSDLAGMVSILPWIQGTFNRELLRSWKRTFSYSLDYEASVFVNSNDVIC